MKNNILEFVNYLNYERHLSNNTVLNYQLDLDNYFSYVKKNNINYITITKDEIREYLKYMRYHSFKWATDYIKRWYNSKMVNLNCSWITIDMKVIKSF